MKKSHVLLLVVLGFLFSCKPASKTEKTDDPYLWLEEIESTKALDWVKIQNAHSDQMIASQPLFSELRDKFLEVFNDDDRIAYPTLVGDYVYNLWQDEVNERGVWRRMLKSKYLNNEQEWEVVLDLDQLSKTDNKKWVFKGAEWLMPENKRCLVSLSDGGKDESEIREFDVQEKAFVKDGFFIDQSKGGASWVDPNTILITKNFGEGTLTNSGYPRIAKKWKRGESIEKAKMVFEADSTDAGLWPYSIYANNKYYSGVYKWITSNQSESYFLVGDKVQKIDYPLDANFAGFYGTELFFALQSDWNINNKTFLSGTLVSFNLEESLKGEINIKKIYEPNERSSFISMMAAKDFILVNIMENVQNKLIKYTVNDGAWTPSEVNVPHMGSIFLVSSDSKSNDFFFRYSNLITPTTLYHGDEKSIGEIKRLKHAFNTEGLVVNQYEASSKDGTKIPYFIVHKKDLEANKKNPTLIYAYGGFNNASQPYYSATRGVGWMESGGVYVLANIRGGGEFGPSWHRAALKEKRQNAYDDLYAVAEDLISRNITSPEHLGVFGWSNGGLMAGVAFTQRPDLFNAVVVGAPLLDMKRYSKLLAGASWMGEYGNPDVDKDWEFLKKYSPYHNVFKDKKYPEVLFVTSTKDDRVHPGHARKMVAKMMDMGHPLFYHETIEGGHGAATTHKQEAHMWATIFTYLNMKLNNVDTNK